MAPRGLERHPHVTCTDAPTRYICRLTKEPAHCSPSACIADNLHGQSREKRAIMLGEACRHSNRCQQPSDDSLPLQEILLRLFDLPYNPPETYLFGSVQTGPNCRRRLEARAWWHEGPCSKEQPQGSSKQKVRVVLRTVKYRKLVPLVQDG